MTLLLRVLNHDYLVDGGPVTASLEEDDAIDIGTAPGCGWVLPDPTKFISRRHCEIRFKDGAYWLTDISTNGTFVNGSDARLSAPHRLRHGDKFRMGEDVQYHIAVEIDAGRFAAPAQDARGPARAGNPWGGAQAGGQAAGRGNPWGQAPGSFSLDPARAIPNPADRRSGGDRPPNAASGSDQDILLALLRAAGLSPDVLRGKDPVQVAQEVGSALRATVEYLRQMLAGRAETKRRIISSDDPNAKRGTTLGPTDNNPLKASQSTDEAFSLMFSEGPGYLKLHAAIEASFADLKAHAFSTFAAIQPAVDELLADLSPDSIVDAAGAARKPKLWEAYLERWHAKAGEGGTKLLEEFWQIYSRQYNKLGK